MLSCEERSDQRERELSQRRRDKYSNPNLKSNRQRQDSNSCIIHGDVIFSTSQLLLPNTTVNGYTSNKHSRATQKYIVLAILLQYNYCNTIVRGTSKLLQYYCHLHSNNSIAVYFWVALKHSQSVTKNN